MLKEYICSNCKEEANGNCACMRNKCIKCGKSVGNITFSICDDCWEKRTGKMKEMSKVREELIKKIGVGSRMSDFVKDLEQLINKHSLENVSNTPDFILAEYMRMALAAFNTAVQQREFWYGRDERPIKRS